MLIRPVVFWPSPCPMFSAAATAAWPSNSCGTHDMCADVPTESHFMNDRSESASIGTEQVLRDRWAAVDAYVAHHLLQADPVLDAALEDSRAAGLPAINVSPAQGKLLFILARSIGARHILEIGTLGGYSAIWLARALPHDGRLVTLEIEHAAAAVARRNIARAGLGHLVDLRVGPAQDLLPTLSDGAERFDFIFVDADKPRYALYLSWAIRLARPGALIVVDNVIREGGVADADSTDPKVRGVRDFYDALAGESRVMATAIQTVGAKSYDGFAVLLVAAEQNVSS
jgi:predicted O-methyltransferase YrrM